MYIINIHAYVVYLFILFTFTVTLVYVYFEKLFIRHFCICSAPNSSSIHDLSSLFGFGYCTNGGTTVPISLELGPWGLSSRKILVSTDCSSLRIPCHDVKSFITWNSHPWRWNRWNPKAICPRYGIFTIIYRHFAPGMEYLPTFCPKIAPNNQLNVGQYVPPLRLGTAGLHEFRFQLADLRLGAPWQRSPGERHGCDP